MRHFTRPILLAASILLSTSSATAQTLSHHLEPLDVFRVQVASDQQISPDGFRIVYVRNSADISTDRRVSSLWIINFDGTGHRALTTGSWPWRWRFRWFSTAPAISNPATHKSSSSRPKAARPVNSPPATSLMYS
jgi:hypothetical protein